MIAPTALQEQKRVAFCYLSVFTTSKSCSRGCYAYYIAGGKPLPYDDRILFVYRGGVPPPVYAFN